jgi:hypothetical protein
MALKFLQTEDGPVKIQLNEESYNKLPEEEKMNIEIAEDAGYLTSAKSQIGNSKGTIPKETVTSDKIEIDAGSALANQFMNLTEDKQAQVLENIGLSKVEATSDKDLYKNLSKEEQEQFRSKTNTKKTGFIKSAGKALSNIADKLETNIEAVMADPGKRALFYAGLTTVDEASRIKPITQAKSPLGMVASGLKEGTQRVKAEELAKANVEAKSKSAQLANQLKMLEFQLKADEQSPYEKQMTDSLNKKLEGILSATSTVPLYGGMKRLVKQRIDSNNFEIPTGVIRSKLPGAIQSIADLLPSDVKATYAPDFFQATEDDAAFIGKFKKLNTDIVLDKISNTKLVPVSDRDVVLVQQTVTQPENTPAVFLATLRSGDAYNYLNAKKVEYGDIFKSERGYKRGSNRNFDSEFLTRGAELIRNEIFAEYGEDKIRQEAKKLGFVQDYKKYQDQTEDFSPYALAEARASLDMGGIDKYGQMKSSAVVTGGKTTVTVPGTKDEVNPDNWKDNPAYKNIGKTKPTD